MGFLIQVRNEFFKETGKKRWKRIAVCTLVIGAVWCFADYLNGSLSFNLWHDLICLGMGVIAERLLPWGKQVR